jgi:hypothetical protein
LTISIAELVCGGWLIARLRRALPSGDARLLRPLLRTAAAAALMAGPAYLVADHLPTWAPSSARLAIVLASATGATVYLLVQALWHSPELTLLTTALRSRTPATNTNHGRRIHAGPERSEDPA